MNLDKHSGIVTTNNSFGKPILEGNPVLQTDYLVKMLKKTDFHSIEKLYCYLDEHHHYNGRLEILIDLTSFWLILDAKEKLEDPDWWGHDDADTLVDVKGDLTGYTASCSIEFNVLQKEGYRVNIAVYYYNSMDLWMAEMKINPEIDQTKCIEDTIIKWIGKSGLVIRNIVFSDFKAIERKKKLQAIAKANELKKLKS